MKANKRIRDLRRRSIHRLTTLVDGVTVGTTRYPWNKRDKDGVQVRNDVRIESRERVR